ncbi:AEC family transporter [Litorivicinus sp.]|nr:AEC family transporter [Litorivicinus sp.]
MIGLIADAVLPIAWILALGFGLKRYVGVEEVVWRGLEKISYWVLMPSLLVAVIIQAPMIAIPWASLLGSLYGVLGLLTLILLIGWLAGLFGSNYASFTSVYQGVIRFNTFISLALMAGLRPDLLPHLGISAATIIVVINIACVSVMTANRPGFAISHVFKELARNPLILACLIGGTCRVLGVPSGFPVSGMALVGQAALPMGVLCLGAGLQWRAVHAGLGLATFSVVTQLVIKPLLFFGMAALTGLTGDWLLVGLLLMCVSTAPSSFILARQLGGDAPLMAGIVAIQTVLSIASVPLVLWVAESMNWIRLL